MLALVDTFFYCRVDDKKAAKEPSFQVAASWQANKDFLLKVTLVSKPTLLVCGTFDKHLKDTTLYFLRVNWGLSARP